MMHIYLKKKTNVGRPATHGRSLTSYSFWEGSLLSLTYCRDNSGGEEETLAEAPVGAAGDVFGRRHSAVVGLDHLLKEALQAFL